MGLVPGSVRAYALASSAGPAAAVRSGSSPRWPSGQTSGCPPPPMTKPFMQARQNQRL